LEAPSIARRGVLFAYLVALRYAAIAVLLYSANASPIRLATALYVITMVIIIVFLSFLLEPPPSRILVVIPDTVTDTDNTYHSIITNHVINQ